MASLDRLTDDCLTRASNVTEAISAIKALCNLLGLHNNVVSLAITNCESLFRCYAEDIQNDGLNWVVCLVYIAAVDSSLPYGLSDPQTGSLDNMSVTVTELLKAANIRVVEFFHRMKLLKNCWSLSDAVLHHLRLVEVKYLVSCPLFDKFQRMFDEIFDGGDANGVDGVNGLIDRKRFCWTLFVYIRALTLSQEKCKHELVLSFHLLLCCLEYIIRLTPSFQLRSPFDSVRILLTSAVDGDILKELCIRFQANEDEVKLIQTTYFDNLIQGLPQTDGVIDVQKLISEYTEHYRSAGDIDELDFLTQEHYLSISNSRLEVNNNATNASTPTNQVTLQRPNLLTPVRAAMNCIQHLLNILHLRTENPSPVVSKYFERCSNNPLPLIAEQLKNLETLFQSSYVRMMGEKHWSIAAQRFKLSRRLYFHIMESMLEAEEERLSQCDFGKLLNQVVFHKSLIACCVEVVLMTYEPQLGSNIQSPLTTPGKNSLSPSVLFPWILPVLSVHAFDFFKVIESFLKAEPRLTPEVVKHLHQIENQILECYSWKTGSPVLDLLQQSEGITSISCSSVNSGVLPNDISSSVGQFLIPSSVDNLDRTRGTITVSPSSSPRRSRSLSMFLNKVFKLASHRLHSLCSVLQVTGDLQHKIWSCLEYCIVQRASLLRDRHLDQILMCSIYAISKVVDREIKFKAVVAAYRGIFPNASQQIFKRVLISGSDYDSIIAFYNKVFMQSVKAYVLQFSVSRGQSTAASPRQATASPRQASPNCQLLGRHNIYVSPMKQSPFKMPPSPGLMTPGTRQLYSFGEGPLSSLRTINEPMRVASNPRSFNPRTSKCLKFDQAEDVEPRRSDDYEEVLKRKVPASRKSLTFADVRPTDSGTDKEDSI